MKIAHIASPNHIFTRKFGGTESIVYNLAKKQISNSHEVTIIAAPSSKDENLKTVSLVKLAKEYNNWLLTWMSMRLNGALHIYRSFKWLASDYDIIHNHVSEEGIALSFLRKSPCLTTLHGTAHRKLLQRSILKLCSIPRNTKLVALSKFAFSQYRSIYGSDLIGYVYSGVDTNLFKFIPNVNKCHEIEICFLGRISPEKSVEKVIQVSDSLHQTGYDVHLKLIGRFWPRQRDYFRKIMDMVNKRKYISKTINATAFEVRRLVGNSDALVFPVSKTEPLALTPLEAMACGTPVISFKRAAAVEYIFDGVNGFLCNDLSEMSAAILRFKEVDRRMCRKIVERKFSVDSMYRGYMKKYRELLGL